MPKEKAETEITSTTLLNETYFEIGGLRWGESHWYAANANWPFAKLQVTPGGIHISVNSPRFKGEFDFSRGEILRITKKRGSAFLNSGIIIEHNKQNVSPYVLFWTVNYHGLRSGLTRCGFEIGKYQTLS